jgi:hypothetical protein
MQYLLIKSKHRALGTVVNEFALLQEYVISDTLQPTKKPGLINMKFCILDYVGEVIKRARNCENQLAWADFADR